MNSVALAFALAAAAAYPPRSGFKMGCPPTKKKPPKVERNRARTRAAKKARKAQRRRQR